MKPITFFYHYNKPMSQKCGKPVISIHYKNRCIMVDNIVIKTNTWSHVRKTQPRLVIKGKAVDITVENGIAYIR